MQVERGLHPSTWGHKEKMTGSLLRTTKGTGIPQVLLSGQKGTGHPPIPRASQRGIR